MTDVMPTPFVPNFGLRERLEQADRPTSTEPLPQFEIKYHVALTKQACPDDPIIRDNLDTIIAANVATDLDQFDSTLHFDNCVFALGATRIANLTQLIKSPYELNKYAYFGTMIHTVQDFYSHSNWVELHENVSPIPVWDVNTSSLPPKIVSGTFLLDWPKLCASGAPTHTKLNKDGPTSEEGQKVVGSGPNKGQSLFNLAFAAALQATRAQYDMLVKQAASFTGDSATRTKMFQDAERILVSDVGAVFINHRTVADLYKPYLKGSELEPDNNGFAAMHWPGYLNMSTLVGSLYISKDVTGSGRKLP